MPFPWLRVLNAVLGVAEVVSKVTRGGAVGSSRAAGTMQLADAPVEAKLAGAAVAALREAFHRDDQRLSYD